MPQYVKIGKLVATHGLNGEFVLQHHLGKKTSLKGLEALFLETLPNQFLPFFIEKSTPKNEQEIYLKLEEINTPEAARKYVAKMVWLEEKDLQKYSSKSAPISFLGFHLIDGETDLGEIIEVIEQPHQLLCAISYKGKEALIPLHEESLIDIDQKNKKIFVELPDGLLDIYA